MKLHDMRLSLALVIAQNERSRNAKLSLTTGDIPIHLLPILARLSLPRNANRSCVSVSLGDTLVVSYPVLVNAPFGVTSNIESSSDVKTVEDNEEDHESLVAFSAVFISERRTSLEPVIQHAAKMLGEALLLQEQIGRFVSEQVDLIQRQHPSLLSDLLSKIGSDLRSQGRTHVELPGGVPLTLTVIPRNINTVNISGDVESPNYMRPYHSLLLLRDASEIAALSCMTSPQILSVLQKAAPTRSIHELQGECGLPASQLLRLAGHLVNHGLAAIVDTISEESLIVLDPDSIPTTFDSEEFKRALRAVVVSENVSETEPLNLELVDFLALISRAASNGLTLRSLMSELTSPMQARSSAKLDRVVIEAVAWLLKRHFVRQQHNYVLLFWPWISGASFINKASDGATKSERETVFDDGSGLPWTQEEADYASSLEAGKPVTIQNLFRRLLVFLRSACVSEALRTGGGSRVRTEGIRVEELLFKLRVSRADLVLVLRTFPRTFISLSA